MTDKLVRQADMTSIQQLISDSLRAAYNRQAERQNHVNQLLFSIGQWRAGLATGEKELERLIVLAVENGLTANARWMENMYSLRLEEKPSDPNITMLAENG